ncbi:MAG: AI-2E family transporter [Pseudomonadota bacterium]|nr:AI-2E family transporter [Pseudomonadota bacterium]
MSSPQPEPPIDTPPSRDQRSEVETVRPTLITYLLLVAVVVVPLLVLLAPYVVSLASGLVLAVLCQPFYARLRRRLSPMFSGLAVTLAVSLLVLAPLTLVVVGGVRQVSLVLDQFKGTDAPTALGFADMVRRWVPLTDLLGSPTEVRDLIAGGLSSVATAVSGVALTHLQMFPAMLLQLALVVLSTYFFLVDGRKLFRWVSGKLPLSGQIMRTLVGSFRSATTAVVLASVAAATAQALCILAAFAALGVPAAFLAAAASFVLAWIPTIGTAPVWGSAAIWLYTQGDPTRAVLMVLVGLVVGVVDNVVRPLVLRGREEMHPLVSLLAILGGLAAFGIPGAFLGPLIASLAISVLDIWPAVASYCGIAVSGSGDEVPDVPLNAA